MIGIKALLLMAPLQIGDRVVLQDDLGENALSAKVRVRELGAETCESPHQLFEQESASGLYPERIHGRRLLSPVLGCLNEEVCHSLCRLA